MKHHYNFSRIIAMLLCAMLATQVRATVSFDIQADALQQANGSLAPVTTLVLLVADTGGNSFGAPATLQNTAVNSVFGDANDRIVGRFDLSINNIPGYFSANPNNIDLSSITDWATGQALGIYWFPTQSLLTTTVTANDPYGFFSGPALDGSDPWVTPGDGGSDHLLYFFNTAGTIQPGTHLAQLGRASFSIPGGVPEPSGALLRLLGLAAILTRRHRKCKTPLR